MLNECEGLPNFLSCGNNYYCHLPLKLSTREVVIAVMTATCISSWWHCLPRAKLARPVRWHPTPQQPKDAGEPETNPNVSQYEEQPDAIEVKVIVDYDLDRDYEGSEPMNEPVAQETKEENPNTEYANMDIPQEGSFHQRMMPRNIMQRIQWVDWEQGLGIMALWLQDMYIQLGFSPEAAKLLIR